MSMQGKYMSNTKLTARIREYSYIDDELKTKIKEYARLADKKDKLKAEILKLSNLDDNSMIYPDYEGNFWCYEKEWIKQHQHVYNDALERCMPLINFQEWCALEDFMGTQITYDDYQILSDYCNNDPEIDGNILDIADLPERKRDLAALLAHRF